MWKILELGFGLLFLAIAINGNETLEQQEALERKKEDLKSKLKKMADKNESIDGTFQPLIKINESDFGVVYKGLLVADNKTKVAMKFVPNEHSEEAQHEFEVYNRLEAYQNPEIERFGIPNLHFYGEWKGFMFIVISYFEDGDLYERRTEVRESRFLLFFKTCNAINGLILFREFVLQTKYLHSHDVRHDDIKPENIMFRKHRSFLIDFDSSSRMNEDHYGGTFYYLSRRFRLKKRNALDDYESFLYTMCRLHNVQLEWDYLNDHNSKTFRKRVVDSRKMRQNTKKTIDEIEKTIESEPLKRVFLEFAKETFQKDSKFPNYDDLYDLIIREIKEFSRPWFTWMSDEQIEEAKKYPMPDIRKEIADPKTSIELIRQSTSGASTSAS